MVTKKEMSIEYTQKEIRGKSKVFTTKKLKKAVMEEMKDTEAISLQKMSSKMEEISSSLSVFKCKWHKLSNQKTEMKKKRDGQKG